MLQLQVLLQHLGCAKIRLQRTREMTLFTGLIPAQAIKFLPTQQLLQLSPQYYYLSLPALNCHRAFPHAREELPQFSPRGRCLPAAHEAFLTCKTLQLLC